MIVQITQRTWRTWFRCAALFFVCSLASAMSLRADEPYARDRNYDLEHSKVAMRFEPEQRKVIGDVTHTLTLLRDGLETISFDSVGLQIENVHLNKSAAKFETTPAKLVVTLPKGAKAGAR